MMGYGSGSGWMWLFWLLVLAGAALVVLVAVRVVGGGIRGSAPPGEQRGSPPPGARARELLDERYARGEISTEEYQERRRGLDAGA